MIANRGDQKSQDLKALRTESTWREAPNSVRNGRECGLHFHLPLASSRVPQAAGRTATGRDPAPQRRGPRGVAPPPRCIARTPPRPRAGPAPPRRAGPSPAPSSAATSAGLPRTPAEAPGSASSAQSCSGGRMPSVSVSCYGNPDRGEFRIRSETEPRALPLPDPPLASRSRASVHSGPSPRPTWGVSPAAPAPSSGNARDADRAEFFFPLYCVKTCQVLVAGSD